MKFSGNEDGSIDWRTVGKRLALARLRGSGGVSRGKKGKTSRRKEKQEKTKRGQRRVYDVTQVTYEIIIGFRDLRASRRAAALARRWLAFHITFATSAARARLFSTCTPQTHPLTPHLRAFSFIFPFIYRISTIARATACYLLFAGNLPCRSDHRHYSSRIHLKRTLKRARDDAAFLSEYIRIVSIKARRTRVSRRAARKP